MAEQREQTFGVGVVADRNRRGTRFQRFVEIADRHAERIGDTKQSAGADPVGAAFVFLNLEGEADGLSQFVLRHSKTLAPGADLPADHGVLRRVRSGDGIGCPDRCCAGVPGKSRGRLGFC
jgi:hypothetical protein